MKAGKESTPLQPATADVVAQPVGARMVLPTNAAGSLEWLTPWSVDNTPDDSYRYELLKGVLFRMPPPQDALDGGTMLPGLTIPVTNIFP
jgi:hypothetical protein